MRAEQVVLCVLLGAIGVGEMGCACSTFGCEPGNKPGALSVEITGVGAESDVKGKHGFVPLDSVSVNGKRLGSFPVKPNELITTHGYVRIDIKDNGKFDYQILMGRHSGSTEEVEGWIENSDPTYVLNTVGWVLGWGYWPVIRDRWVSAAAIGTTIALERVDTTTDRVYLLENSSTSSSKGVVITCLANGAAYTLEKEGHYVKILDTCDTQPWPPTPEPVTDPAVKEIVEKMMDAASAAGMK